MQMADEKQLVQKQFGDKAEAYAGSVLHARGGSLARLVELVEPQAGWQVLDVATAVGHTAHTFAPHVASVIATDITYQMLPKAREMAWEKGLKNVHTAVADAETLPFAPASFDLVTCRIAPHHFPQPVRFVQEAARLLKPGGIFALVDNIVPHTRSRKKRNQREYEAAQRYINAFEKLRDPSHGRALSLLEWNQHIKQAHLTITHTETMCKTVNFHDWATRMKVSEENYLRLRAMLVQAPALVVKFLTPDFSGDTINFQLTEAIIIAVKSDK